MERTISPRSIREQYQICGGHFFFSLIALDRAVNLSHVDGPGLSSLYVVIPGG